MKHKILLIIFGICLLASALLATIPTDSICGDDDSSSCSVVNNSSYKKTLGVSNSYLGITAFIALIFITLSHMKNPRRIKNSLLTAGIIITSIAALYFIYLQAFVIKAFCIYCMIVDIGSILALVVIYIYWKR